MSKGLLLNLAVGDAYGAGFEFADPRFIAKYNNLKAYRQHPTHPLVKPGKYTDDTQMSIALAELLVSGDPLTTMAWANKVVAVFKRDPRIGYSNGFYTLLCQVKDGTGLLSKLLPHSTKNGAAMRAPLLGLIDKWEDLADLATWQANLTHATREGVLSAQASATLVWLCRLGCERKDLAGEMEKFIPWCLTDLWDGEVPTAGMATVHAALSAIMKRNNLRDILWQCVQYTGDVDTVAAIAMAAASQHPDIEQNLPSFLFDKLENGTYGRDYIEALDRKLVKVFDAPREEPLEPDVVDPEEDPLDFIDELFGGSR